MSASVRRILSLSILMAPLLGGCESTGTMGKLFDPSTADARTDGAVTGTVASQPAAYVPDAPGPTIAAASGLTGDLPTDPVSVGKRHYREGHFGLAEQAFRKAVEEGPRDAEAWVGLAASYDRLRRFDLADRAYTQAIRIVGTTPVILNNQGYSLMLRGELKTARSKLAAARAMDPGNAVILANLDMLDASQALGKDVR
ncbi:tetratricopeptide repeat protein [Prosthecomicrobium sp. N25]|uniref:tetratricopeptide repeat protein n=1 Tax=Prosthecomicrobium sp. N25 TaxID=3129254 RepID=UPI0030779861